MKSIEAVKNEVANQKVEVNHKIKPPYPVLLTPRSYPLNKSKSKFATVGLCCYGSFGTAVVLHGQKNDWILLDDAEWKILCENAGLIRNYLYSSGEFQPQPVAINGMKKICFHTIGENKVILLQDRTASDVYLGAESIVELWELVSLIDYRKEILKTLEFDKFYVNIINGVANFPGDYKNNIESVLANLNIKSDNVLCMREMLKYAEQIIRCDVELDQLGQMLNA